jgi:hypothetical protein
MEREEVVSLLIYGLLQALLGGRLRGKIPYSTCSGIKLAKCIHEALSDLGSIMELDSGRWLIRIPITRWSEGMQDEAQDRDIL